VQWQWEPFSSGFSRYVRVATEINRTQAGFVVSFFYTLKLGGRWSEGNIFYPSVFKGINFIGTPIALAKKSTVCHW
jgi:hypothetical protein